MSTHHEVCVNILHIIIYQHSTYYYLSTFHILLSVNIPHIICQHSTYYYLSTFHILSVNIPYIMSKLHIVYVNIPHSIEFAIHLLGEISFASRFRYVKQVNLRTDHSGLLHSVTPGHSKVTCLITHSNQQTETKFAIEKMYT